jgi:DMSO/TMAO reductase YedYZ molybdopterin-dependent catalytic subunit
MTTLRIEGAVETARDWTFDDLRAFPRQEEDLARLAPGREGAGVSLGALIASSGPRAEAQRVTMRSADGGFEATVPLAGLEAAFVLYRRGDEPLPEGAGGPFRVVIPDSAACGQAPLDACANVKDLGIVIVHGADAPELGSGKPSCD